MNSHFRHGKAAGYRYIMGARYVFRIVKDREHRDHPLGGARISATSPTKKPDVVCDTGFGLIPLKIWPSVTSAGDGRVADSPFHRRNAHHSPFGS